MSSSPPPPIGAVRPLRGCGNKTRIIDLHEGETVDASALGDLIRAGEARNVAKAKPTRRT
jgi:hypothetical protein